MFWNCKVVLHSHCLGNISLANLNTLEWLSCSVNERCKMAECNSRPNGSRGDTASHLQPFSLHGNHTTTLKIVKRSLNNLIIWRFASTKSIALTLDSAIQIDVDLIEKPDLDSAVLSRAKLKFRLDRPWPRVHALQGCTPWVTPHPGCFSKI